MSNSHPSWAELLLEILEAPVPDSSQSECDLALAKIVSELVPEYAPSQQPQPGQSPAVVEGDSQKI